VLRLVWQAVGRDRRRLAEGVVLLLEGLDRATRRVTGRWDADGDRYGDAVREARQGAIAHLLSPDVPLTADVELGPAEREWAGERRWLEVSTARWVVVCTGSFGAGASGDGAGGTRGLDDGTLAAWGVTTELARAVATRFALAVPPVARLPELLRSHADVRAVAAAAFEFGYDLDIVPGTIQRALSLAKAQAPDGPLVPVAARLLAEAATRRLARAVERWGAREAVLVVAPDDLEPAR
jgi:hypothetical protein